VAEHVPDKGKRLMTTTDGAQDVLMQHGVIPNSAPYNSIRNCQLLGNRGFMPRTLGAVNIKPWEIEQILRSLALGASYAELSEEFGYQEQTLRVLGMKRKHEVSALLADATAKLDQTWSMKVENHVRVLTERWEQVWHQIDLLHAHAHRETETIRNIDPEASEVPVNDRVLDRYSRLELALSHQILEITGQLPQRYGKLEMEVSNPLNLGEVLVETEDGVLHPVVQR
jgi:hypothetical protein